MSIRTADPADAPDLGDLAELRADLAVATRLVPTTWPLPSFVAANPLRAFEHLAFEDACRLGRRWFGATTHRTIEWYRAAAARGEIGTAALSEAVRVSDPLLAGVAPSASGADPIDIVVDDLLHGPVAPAPAGASDPWVDGVVGHVAAWCATYVDPHPNQWLLPDRDEGFFAAWRASAVHDRRLRTLVGRAGLDRIGRLPDDPVAAIDAAFDDLTIASDERVDALRALLVRLPGWSGLARWVDEWAPSGGLHLDLHVVDIVAVLAAIDAARGHRTLTLAPAPVVDQRDDAELFAARVSAAADRAGLATDAGRQWVAGVLGRDTLPERAQLWLVAHECQYRDELLAVLGRIDPGPSPDRPSAQLVMCIDVRSEAFRRHVETIGSYETFGFAGFFGIPVGWRPFDAPLLEARCPVLLAPRHEVAEIPVDAEASLRTGERRRGWFGAHHGAKSGLGAPFAFAESAGWFRGVGAALRTFLPGRVAQLDASAVAPALTIAAEQFDRGGITLEQRALYAEALVTTIGMHRFARLVLLCGHASHTVNNPHAAALDCGACGGAPGGVNARVAATILNDPEVRAHLASRGHTIPDDTWFLAGEHDTTTDVVELFDLEHVPQDWEGDVQRLRVDLGAASAATAAERARRLPGSPPAARGVDWAEIRPEWGLAGNAAFVVAPRSATRRLDLGGRAFLHSYDAARDPDGVALETIMTAPMVVAQWISSQYYFSTVDPDVFGAGDKLVHNVVGGVGVLRGESGDLAVGLPWQSVGIGVELEHAPLRLLVLIQAPLDRIDAIIERNPGVRDLIDNGWIHLGARSDGDEPWSLRGATGRWTPYRTIGVTESRAVAAVGATS